MQPAVQPQTPLPLTGGGWARAGGEGGVNRATRRATPAFKKRVKTRGKLRIRGLTVQPPCNPSFQKTRKNTKEIANQGVNRATRRATPAFQKREKNTKEISF